MRQFAPAEPGERPISGVAAGEQLDDTAILAVERVAVPANSAELAAGLAV